MCCDCWKKRYVCLFLLFISKSVNELNVLILFLNLLKIYLNFVAVRISLFSCAESEVIKNEFTFKLSKKLLVFKLILSLFFCELLRTFLQTFLQPFFATGFCVIFCLLFAWIFEWIFAYLLFRLCCRNLICNFLS